MNVRLRLFLTLLTVATLTLAAMSTAASATPLNSLDVIGNSTAAPGGSYQYNVLIINTGDEPTPETFPESFEAAEPYVVSASLPPGVVAQSTSGFVFDCSETTFPSSTVSCRSSFILRPGEFVKLVLDVTVDPGFVEGDIVTTTFDVSGGSAPSPTSGVKAFRASATPPPFGIDAFDGQVTANAGGDPFTQAAGHPYAVTTAILFNTVTNPVPVKGSVWPVEPTKNISVDLPAGFAGFPTATGETRCTASQLANAEATVAKPLCPPGSQVGISKVITAGGTRLGGSGIPVFNMVPPPGVPARFGINIAGSLVILDGELRSGSDYGLSVNVRDVAQGLAISGTEIAFWGVPSDSSHDAERACPGQRAPGDGGPHCDSEAPRRAFLRNPTSCQGPQPTTLRIDSWADPGDFEEASFLSHNPPAFPFAPQDWGAPQGTTGCADVPFEPTITVRATNHAADSPTGLDVDLSMPQSDDPATIGQADVKDAHVTLPAGMVVNPAAAAGLVGCSQADVGLDNAADPQCPDASKIGTVEIESPQLPEPLHGSIYQATQFDNPSGSLLGFYTVAKGPGLTIKLAAHVERDLATGQLTTVFEDSPQLPFDHYVLHFNDGPRAPLINPPTCGTATSHAVFTSWARPGEDVVREDSFQVTSGPNGTACPNGLGGRPFSPKLDAGLTDPTAGAVSPFVMKLTREDGEQRLRELTVTTPPGLSAYLRGVPYCPESAIAAARARSNPGQGAAELASPSCPAASQLGTLSAGTGAGPIPYHVNTGRVYLAGPYKGAPLSLAFVVPAVAGPLDLGNVVIQAAIHVDPATAKLTVVSDPLPQIIEGIPLDLRSLYLAIDRPHFTLAPTSCEPMSVDGALGGSDGAVAAPSSHFQVGGCAALGFKPKLALRLRGGTKRGDNPSFTATLTARPGDANIRRAVVSLPHSEFLDQSHIRTICTRAQFAAERCPPGSVYGRARAISPLLDRPLEGPVYLRSSNNPLPDLVAALDGQIQIDLAGRIDTVNEGIRNTFAVVPDAPVSKFTLTMKGGRKGLLVNSRNLCRSTNRATVRFTAHNGKVANSRPVLKSSCGKKADAKQTRKADRRTPTAP